jgi:hypothetical protein
MLHKLANNNAASLESYSAAARLGSLMARREAAALHPAAQLCSAMVQQAMR